MAKLTVVPTPVGNLEDMTFRAIRVLKEADLILAEDTRTTGILLKHFEIQNRMQSHHKFNEHKTVEQVAARIKAGENIALVSDAGTPAISDPGFMLVRECVRQGVEVECLPGATAFVPASKIHEETVRGTLEEVIAHFTVNEPKGEIVIVLAGLKDKKDKETGTEV